MAARRTRVTTGRRRAPSSWARFTPTSGAYVSVGVNTKTLLGGFSLSNPGIGETVRRTRGMFSLKSTAGVGVFKASGAVGLMVVNDIAFAAGASAIPGPISDASDDGWFLWEPFSSPLAIAGAVTGSSPTYQVDSKAMRRVEEGFTIAVMVENASGADTLEIYLALSMLTSLS